MLTIIVSPLGNQIPPGIQPAGMGGKEGLCGKFRQGFLQQQLIIRTVFNEKDIDGIMELIP